MRRKNKKNLPRWGQKVCNKKKKINSLIKKPHLKRIPNKENCLIISIQLNEILLSCRFLWLLIEIKLRLYKPSSIWKARSNSRQLVISFLFFFYVFILKAVYIHIYIYIYIYIYIRREWTRRPEFKSWTRLIAFHIALIPLGKVWIQLFSLQLWVDSRTD